MHPWTAAASTSCYHSYRDLFYVECCRNARHCSSRHAMLQRRAAQNGSSSEVDHLPTTHVTFTHNIYKDKDIYQGVRYEYFRQETRICVSCTELEIDNDDIYLMDHNVFLPEKGGYI
jgi:hypothetical protein